jgi:molybdate transport system substrate-binding protein
VRALALILAMFVTPMAARADATVSLYAAGSLTGTLGEVAKAYAGATGVEVATAFGPSGQMRERIEAGEPATVFASADFGHPERLAEAGKAWQPVVFARNRLCLMVRPGLAVGTDGVLEAMLDPMLKLGTSTPGNDPSGDYAWAVFAKADAARPGSKAALEAKALQLAGGKDSAKSPAGRSAYAWHLAEGRADLFLGYCSNGIVAAAELPGLTVTELPDTLSVGADYGLAVLTGPSGQEAAAARFAMFILSTDGQAILARWGFAPVAAPGS